MARIKDVARRAGVSTATVSRVLNGLPDVNPETRDKVVKAAGELNYQPHATARNLRRRREARTELSYDIGILQSYDAALSAGFWTGEVLESVAQAVRGRGYGLRLITCSMDGEVPDEISNSEVDGVILLGTGSVVTAISKLAPTVTIDAYMPEHGAYGLVPDYRSGIREAVGRLLAKGHRHITTTCGPIARSNKNGFGFADQVIAGCVEAYDSMGIALPEILQSSETPLTPQQGYEFGLKILSSGTKPDAIVGSDAALFGLYRAADEKGVRIPDDLSVIGTDGIRMGAYLTPPLTTVDVQIDQIGALAVRIIADSAAKGKIRQGLEITPVKFVERASARI